MKKFIIERNLPGAGNLTPEELQIISEASCDAIARLGKPYHWIESYITNDRIYCIHIAESECDVREQFCVLFTSDLFGGKCSAQ